MSQTNLQNYVPSLTGVRALAAYLVFLSHYYYNFGEIFPQSVNRLFSEFHIGVTIFFVLSGFLITYRYYNNFHLTKDWFKQYLKNRVARIYPMYALLTIAAFAYFFITGEVDVTKGYNPWAMLVMNITFLRGFFFEFWDTGVAQGWSLTVEECFYFSAPFAFYIAIKHKKFWLQPLVITSFAALMVLIFSHVDFFGFFGNFTFVMLFTFFGRCFEFFVGMQLARYVLSRGTGRTNKVPYTYLGFVLIFVCAYAMSLLPIPKGFPTGLQNPFGIVINNYLLPVAIAWFFYGLLTEGSILKKFFATKTMELLGKSSYIFYLIHLGWMYLLLHGWFEKGNDYVFGLYDQWQKDWISPFQFEWLNMTYAFIILNLVSIALFKLIEEPLNHYIRKSDFLIKNPKKNPENKAELIK
ncbi:acyltransferase family protein [Mucilaginibacter hurinus]|uniref:acyltransferase family protein n=1 Tax=Mucilaginibacter hurinus TaxID=2201324 RepID=UPI001314C43A|nr:acyltransferase [Mucilaginibacter hurinus]